MTCPKVTQPRSDSKDAAPPCFRSSGSLTEPSSHHGDKLPGLQSLPGNRPKRGGANKRPSVLMGANSSPTPQWMFRAGPLLVVEA